MFYHVISCCIMLYHVISCYILAHYAYHDASWFMGGILLRLIGSYLPSVLYVIMFLGAIYGSKHLAAGIQAIPSTVVAFGVYSISQKHKYDVLLGVNPIACSGKSGVSYGV